MAGSMANNSTISELR